MPTVDIPTFKVSGDTAYDCGVALGKAAAKLIAAGFETSPELATMRKNLAEQPERFSRIKAYVSFPSLPRVVRTTNSSIAPVPRRPPSPTRSTSCAVLPTDRASRSTTSC